MKRLENTIPSCDNCSNDKKFFCALSNLELEKMGMNKKNFFYKKGEEIFQEGSYPHGVFCIYKGKVKLSKRGNEGKEQIIRFASNGDILGYRSMLAKQAYSTTAVAMEDVWICQIPVQNYEEMLKDSNKLCMKTIELLSADLKRSENQVLSVSQKRVVDRLAEALLSLKNKFGLKDDHQTLNIQITRREIGEMAGITTATTIRTLSEFNRDGIVALEKKNIKLLNIPLLEKLASSYY